MPVFNEQNNIESFLKDLEKNFIDLSYLIIIVDDCSTDSTLKILIELKDTNFPIKVISNPKNIGHGGSTLVGISQALMCDTDYIITVDGDGNVEAEKIRKMFDFLAANKNFKIVEGVRIERKDDWFRVFASWMTRKILRIISGVNSSDANTPLRVYRKNTLQYLSQQISINSMIPNLQFGILTRVQKFEIAQIDIPVVIRSSINSQGTTWNQKYKKIPSKKFILFCIRASLQLLKFNPRLLKNRQKPR